MSDKITVRQLTSILLDLLEDGYGDKIVELSVNYSHCDHIQPLGEVWCSEADNINWITLRGLKE